MVGVPLTIPHVRHARPATSQAEPADDETLEDVLGSAKLVHEGQIAFMWTSEADVGAWLAQRNRSEWHPALCARWRAARILAELPATVGSQPRPAPPLARPMQALCGMPDLHGECLEMPPMNNPFRHYTVCSAQM